MFGFNLLLIASFCSFLGATFAILEIFSTEDIRLCSMRTPSRFRVASKSFSVEFIFGELSKESLEDFHLPSIKVLEACLKVHQKFGDLTVDWQLVEGELVFVMN